jgi:hypothetical protein
VSGINTDTAVVAVWVIDPFSISFAALGALAGPPAHRLNRRRHRFAVLMLPPPERSRR